MKKLMTLVLIFALVLSLAACGGGGKKASGSIVYGSTTELSGDFWTTMWGNNASDAVVKDLIHGYSTVTYSNQEGEYIIDPTVVKEHKVEENADGSKTYTFTINDDLVYNDETKITAKDFVFMILGGSNKAFVDAGAGSVMYGYYFVGFDDYNAGTTDVFKGVHLVDDYTFSVQIKPEELPNFFELELVAAGPWPMHVIAPEATIEETAEGAKIGGTFSTDVINETVLNNETGYRYLPKVTCGPYNLDSFDKASKIATLKVNDKFKGTYDGQKPGIETIVIKKTQSATEMDELIAGTVDILPQVGGKDAIPPGLDAADEGKIQYSTFPRNGFGYISFVCDLGPTQFVKVRQAIACLLDVPEFARTYSGGYATTVNGYYGVAQWMYKDNKEAIENELDKYALDLARAEQLLVEDGWTLNKSGGEFQKGTDDVRYKKVDGKLMALHIEHMSTTDNPVSELISTMLPDNMKAVGMSYNQTQVDFPVLLENFYGQVETRKYNMYNLATGFYPSFDPSFSYSDDPKYLGDYNQSYLLDKEVSDDAQALKQTKVGDKEEYSAKWLKFQKRWNELCPMIPLYSDEYHAFFSNKLKNYDADGFWTFQYAILYATVEE